MFPGTRLVVLSARARAHLFSAADGRTDGAAAGAATAVDAERAADQPAFRIARRYRAVSRELRAAMALAELDRARGEAHDAVTLAAALYGQFTAGLGRWIRCRAKALIDTVQGRAGTGAVGAPASGTGVAYRQPSRRDEADDLC